MAGFVIKPEDWKYSSARDFAGVKGLIELDFMTVSCANGGIFVCLVTLWVNAFSFLSFFSHEASKSTKGH